MFCAQSKLEFGERFKLKRQLLTAIYTSAEELATYLVMWVDDQRQSKFSATPFSSSLLGFPMAA